MNIFTTTFSDAVTPLTTFLLFASPHLSLFQGFIGPVLVALGLLFFPFCKPGVHGEVWLIPCLLSCSLWLMAVSSHHFPGTTWYQTGFPHLWSASQRTEKNLKESKLLWNVQQFLFLLHLQLFFLYHSVYWVGPQDPVQDSVQSSWAVGRQFVWVVRL